MILMEFLVGFGVEGMVEERRRRRRPT